MTGVLLWLVAAVAATAVGLAAVAAIGTDIFGAGQDPLSQSEVDDLLASRTTAPTSQSPPPSTTPSTTTSTTPAPPAGQRTDTVGGTVIARCTAEGLVEVLSATPKQGYQVESDDEVEDHPSVKFSAGEDEIEVRLRCAGGTVSAEVKIDD